MSFGFDNAGDPDDDRLGGERPLAWYGLDPDTQWAWFQRLWRDVCMLRERYRLAVRTRWWEDAIQVEALAALAAWVARYDTGEWLDPPGKLGLLFELERISGLLRDGREPFAPDRDRHAFTAWLTELGCAPPARSTNRTFDVIGVARCDSPDCSHP